MRLVNSPYYSYAIGRPGSFAYESRGVAKKEKGLANAKQVPVHLMAFGRS